MSKKKTSMCFFLEGDSKRENFNHQAVELQEFVANADESASDYEEKLQVLTKEKDEAEKKTVAYKMKKSRLNAVKNFKHKAAELQEFVANADESASYYEEKSQVLTKEKNEVEKKTNTYKMKESRLNVNETYKKACSEYNQYVENSLQNELEHKKKLEALIQAKHTTFAHTIAEKRSETAIDEVTKKEWVERALDQICEFTSFTLSKEGIYHLIAAAFNESETFNRHELVISTKKRLKIA